MNWFTVAAIGGVVGLDSTALGQVMISRPLIAATLTGLAFGRPLEGAVIGAILEAFALVVLPVGAARYPESGLGAVAAAASYAATAPLAPNPEFMVHPEFMLIAVVFGLLWEWLAGASVRRIRDLNGWLIGAPALEGRLTAGQLELRSWLAILLDFGRAVVIAVFGTALGILILGTAGPAWGLSDQIASGTLAVAVAAMIGSVIAVFGGLPDRRVSFGLGLALGLGGVLLL